MRMSLFYESGCSYRYFTYFFKSAYCGAIHSIRGKSANRSVALLPMQSWIHLIKDKTSLFPHFLQKGHTQCLR